MRVTVSALLLSALGVDAQTTSDTIKSAPKKFQARAPTTQPFGAKAFGKSKKTTLRWLGMAGFLINSRGTTFMVDPLLEGFDMPLMNFNDVYINDIYFIYQSYVCCDNGFPGED